jgi:tetratricopeptide (TPR) repeat protein
MLRRMSRYLGIFIVISVIGTSPVYADTGIARKAYEKGMVSYNLQRYDDALVLFQRSYEEKQDPIFLFNIGQCQRQLGQYAAAARSYRTYVSQLPDAPNRDQAMRLAEKMDEADREAKAKTPPTGVMSLQAASAAAPDPAAAAPQAVDRPARWYRSPLGWSLLGGGLVVAAVGGGLLSHGVDLDHQIASASSRAQAQDLANDRDRFRPAGIALLVVGSAAAVSGVIVFGVAAKRSRPQLRASADVGGAH